MYTIEHIIIAFVTGAIIGVVSTLLFDRKGLTLETTIALLLMVVWLTMHTYSFFIEGSEVDWVFNLVGFGAVGTFVGVNVRHLSIKELSNILRK